jgi:branched-chain amino acid transport system permease protein
MRQVVRGLCRYGRVVRAALIVTVLLFALSVPQLGSTFYASLGLSVLAYGLVAMSLDIIAGYTGLLSLCHAAFLAVGGYGVAYSMKMGLNPTAAVCLALVAVLLVASVFGLAAVRVKELTFAILTLALGQIVWGLAYRWVSVSGGDNGLPVGTRPSLGPIDLTDNSSFYYFVLAIFVVCAVLMWMIVRSPFGLSLQGIRDNEPRMRTLGYAVALHKYLAFVISAFFCGIAGIILAFSNLYVSPGVTDFAHNGMAVQMVVVGGLGTLWGPLGGAVVIVLLQQLASIYVQRWMTVLGILFVLVVLFARTGMWGGILAFVRWVVRRYGDAGPTPWAGSVKSDGGVGGRSR